MCTLRSVKIFTQRNRENSLNAIHCLRYEVWKFGYTGTQEGYWTKASRLIYPDPDCRCGAESTSFREVEPWSHTETPGMPNVYQDDSRMAVHSVRWQHHLATYSIVRLLSQWMSTFCNSYVTVVGTISRCDLWYSADGGTWCIKTVSANKSN